VIVYDPINKTVNNIQELSFSQSLEIMPETNLKIEQNIYIYGWASLLMSSVASLLLALHPSDVTLQFSINWNLLKRWTMERHDRWLRVYRAQTLKMGFSQLWKNLNVIFFEKKTKILEKKNSKKSWNETSKSLLGNLLVELKVFQFRSLDLENLSFFLCRYQIIQFNQDHKMNVLLI